MVYACVNSTEQQTVKTVLVTWMLINIINKTRTKMLSRVNHGLQWSWNYQYIVYATYETILFSETVGWPEQWCHQSCSVQHLHWQPVISMVDWAAASMEALAAACCWTTSPLTTQYLSSIYISLHQLIQNKHNPCEMTMPTSYIHRGHWKTGATHLGGQGEKALNQICKHLKLAYSQPGDVSYTAANRCSSWWWWKQY